MKKLLVIFLFSTAVQAVDCLQELSLFQKPKSSYVQLADHFKVYEFRGYTLLMIKDMKGESNQFLLSDEINKIDSLCPGTPKFQVPVSRIVVSSTTHLPPFEMLKAWDNLIAITNSKYVTSPGIQKAIKDDKIKDTGYPLNSELILSFKPKLLITYSVESKEIEGITKLERLGLPVVANYDFIEDHPLKRAEWLKFVALFVDKKKEAGLIYNKIAKNYKKLKKLVSQKKKPLVVVGKSSGEIWQAPGGKSDFATLLRDAGGDYIWKRNSSSTTISKNIEEVYTNVAKVDFWFPQNNWLRIKDVLKEDSRFKNFLLLKNCYVFNYTKKTNSRGGNDYWETGVMRPDLLLKDLIAVLHPEVVPEHQMIWYQELK